MFSKIIRLLETGGLFWVKVVVKKMSMVSGLEPMIGIPVPMLGSSSWRMINGSTIPPTVRVATQCVMGMF